MNNKLLRFSAIISIGMLVSLACQVSLPLPTTPTSTLIPLGLQPTETPAATETSAPATPTGPALTFTNQPTETEAVTATPEVAATPAGSQAGGSVDKISGDYTYTNGIALDTYYVRNWSPWLDVYLLARTVTVVLARAGAY